MFGRLALGFANAGLSVDLVLASATGPNLEGLSPTVRVIDLKCQRVLASVVPLARYLHHARPSVLISTLHYANLVAVWARSLTVDSPLLILREATTMSVAASNSREVREQVILALARMFYPRADVVVANSKGSAGLVRRRPGCLERGCIPNRRWGREVSLMQASRSPQVVSPTPV